MENARLTDIASFSQAGAVPVLVRADHRDKSYGDQAHLIMT